MNAVERSMFQHPARLRINGCVCGMQAQQAADLLAADAAGAAAPGPSSNSSLPEAPGSEQAPPGASGNGSGPLAGDSATKDTSGHSSGNGSHPPEGVAAGRIPVLLCGDMNAEPHSAACQVTPRHSIAPQDHDCRTGQCFDHGNADRLPTPSGITPRVCGHCSLLHGVSCLRCCTQGWVLAILIRQICLQALRGHALGLRSLWDAGLADPSLEEALLTTWKFRAEEESRRIIDYIW